MRNNFFIIPFIILIIWTFLVASKFTWNLPIFILLVLMLSISHSLGIYQSKQNRKKLESVLEQIKNLRE